MIARDNTPVSPSTPPSSRPVPGLSAVFAGRQTWIPAFAGMTVEGVWRRAGGGGVGHGRRILRERWTVRAAPALPAPPPIVAAPSDHRRRCPIPLLTVAAPPDHRRRCPALPSTVAAPSNHPRRCPAPPLTVAAPSNHQRPCPAPSSTVSAQKKHRHPRERQLSALTPDGWAGPMESLLQS